MAGPAQPGLEVRHGAYRGWRGCLAAGGKSQRRVYLAALRARDPAAARELITQSWAAAGPERVMFLSVLANEELSLADEPLLEAALDERDA